jgi:hypothetical protein
MFNIYHFCNKIAGLVVLLRSSHIKEHEMKPVRYQYVCREDYCHLIDMYFKLEMKFVLEKILYAHTQGSFNIALVRAA